MVKIEKLRFILQRIDTYYNNVNSKGAFFLGINTFLLGGCFVTLRSQKEFETSLVITFIIISIFALFSIISVLRAILPFVQSGHHYDYKSMIFFGSIARKDFNDFEDQITNSTDEDFERDLTKQVYVLSKGLTKKFLRIRDAGVALLFVLFTAFFFFFQIINLKS